MAEWTRQLSSTGSVLEWLFPAPCIFTESFSESLSSEAGLSPTEILTIKDFITNSASLEAPAKCQQSNIEHKFVGSLEENTAIDTN